MGMIYLLRHGATAFNRQVPPRLQGQANDPELDEIGRAQAGRAAEALRSVAFEAAYCSPLRRARETAQIVAAPHGLELVSVPELIEGDLGRWEGRTWDEIEADEPDMFRAFMANPGTVPYPEGESFADVGRRATAALERLADAHPNGRALVVAHNIVNRAVLGPLLGLPIDRARGLRQANCGINVLIRDAAARRWTVETLNAALHLDGLKAG